MCLIFKVKLSLVMKMMKLQIRNYMKFKNLMESDGDIYDRSVKIKQCIGLIFSSFASFFVCTI